MHQRRGVGVCVRVHACLSFRASKVDALMNKLEGSFSLHTHCSFARELSVTLVLPLFLTIFFLHSLFSLGKHKGGINDSLALLKTNLESPGAGRQAVECSALRMPSVYVLLH